MIHGFNKIFPSMEEIDEAYYNMLDLRANVYAICEMWPDAFLMGNCRMVVEADETGVLSAVLVNNGIEEYRLNADEYKRLGEGTLSPQF